MRNLCRRKDVQIGTVEALIASLDVRRDLALLTTDEDFRHMVEQVELSFAN